MKSCTMLVERRGFALIIVLWCTIGAAALTTVAASVAREQLAATSHRLAYVRDMWTAKGCLATVRAHVDALMADRLRFGDGGERAWQSLSSLWLMSPIRRALPCDVSFEPSGTTVDVNTVRTEVLTATVTSLGVTPKEADSLAAALLDWRDSDDRKREGGAERATYELVDRVGPRNALLRDDRELKMVRGWDRLRGAEQLFGIAPGRISLSYAPAAILRSIPGMGDEAVGLVVLMRGPDHRPVQLEAVAGMLGGAAGDTLRRHLAEASAATAATPDAWFLSVRSANAGIAAPFTLKMRLTRDGVGIATSSMSIEWR